MDRLFQKVINRKIIFCMIAFLGGTTIQAQNTAPWIDGTATLGIVRDGQSQHFEPSFTRIKAQLETFVHGDYQIQYPEFMGDYTSEGIMAQLLAALENPDVEVVFTGGLIATQLASRLPAAKRTKPIFGGFPQLSERVDRPGVELDTKNYTYISIPNKISQDLRMLKGLSGQQIQYLLLDQSYVECLVNLPLVKSYLESQTATTLELIPVVDSADQAIRKLPENCKSVYVSILPRFTNDELRKLYHGLTQQGIITFSMEGQKGLNEGAMAAMVGVEEFDSSSELETPRGQAEEIDPVIRRTAINLHQLFLGLAPEDLEVHLPSQEFLRINIETSDKIPWYADYDTYLSADFMGLESRRIGETLTLHKAMQLAEHQNPRQDIARHDVTIAKADRGLSRAGLLPNISFNAFQNRSELGGDKADPNLDYVGAGSYGIQMNQLLFDDSLRSRLRAAGINIEAAENDAESVRLDVKSTAAHAFLNTLAATALFDIQKENLRRTQSNLRLAQIRQEIGAAEPTEVFRWQSASAQNRASLVQQEARLDIANYNLNLALGMDRHTTWSMEDIHVDPDMFLFMDETLVPFVKTERDFDRMVRFFQSQSILNAPELSAFDRTLESQGIILRQKKRSYYVPRIGLSAGFQRTNQKSNLASYSGQNELSSGINFTFPLFQGGLRKSDIQRQEALIQKIEAQRESIIQQLEVNALSAIHQMSASHANIKLSWQARIAAKKNYDSIVERYYQGAANILELLDAQSGYIQQKSATVTANYDYLNFVVSLQRAIAWFEDEKSDGQRQLMNQALQEYLTQNTR